MLQCFSDGGEKRKVRKKDVFLIKSGSYNSTIYRDPTFFNEILKRIYFEGTVYKIRGLVLRGERNAK